MAEYIEREALLDDLDAAAKHGGLGAIIAQTLQRYVKRVPAADVAPVRHAFWKEIGADKRGRGGIFRCAGADGCGKTHPYTCDYCPNCGARMDGDPDGLR